MLPAAIMQYLVHIKRAQDDNKDVFKCVSKYSLTCALISQPEQEGAAGPPPVSGSYHHPSTGAQWWNGAWTTQ